MKKLFLLPFLGIVILSSYRCPILWTFGVSCPGCGMTRAVFALLRLDFVAAFRLHPLVYVLPFYLLAVGWCLISDRCRLLSRCWFWGSFAGLFLGVWFFRLIAFLMGELPAFIQPNALFPSCFRLLAEFLK
ncbi:MAG: DUF2752 domain-containing protein [Anaerotruncus sp.]|nr:DUF2752 domain-containing protein [Anaerotruncus sp.]